MIRIFGAGAGGVPEPRWSSLTSYRFGLWFQHNELTLLMTTYLIDDIVRNVLGHMIHLEQQFYYTTIALTGRYVRKQSYSTY